MLTLAHRVRRFDQAFVVRGYYRPSGFYWKQAFDTGTRDHVLAELKRLESATGDAETSLAALTLRYRFGALSDRDAAHLKKLDVRPLLNTLQGATFAVLAQEILLLLHAVQAWGPLADIAVDVMQEKKSPARVRGLAADMLVQARYQQIKSHVFRNTITPEHIIPLRDAIASTQMVLGAGDEKLYHYQGLMACIEGDLNTAVSLHAQGKNGGYATQFFRAADNIMPIETIREMGKQSVPSAPWLDWKMRHEATGDCTLVSCDATYFAQYFDGFVESFGLLNPGGLIHIHAVGFCPREDRINDLEDRFDVRINMTHDRQNLHGQPPDIQKGYYAGARYMYLPDYMTRYARIVIHDIDGALILGMDGLWQGRAGTIQISSLVLDPGRKGHFVFWSNIGAGAFAIENTPENTEFARAVSIYLRNRFKVCRSTGGRFFFTDQIGLLLATLAFKDRCKMVKMPQIFTQSGVTAGTGRGQAKKQAQAQALKKMKDQRG